MSMHRAENTADQVFAPTLSLKMRCPSCSKLYSVQAGFVAQFSKNAEAPKFQCVDCQVHFLALIPADLSSGSLDTVSADSTLTHVFEPSFKRPRARLATESVPLLAKRSAGSEYVEIPRDPEADERFANDVLLGGNRELVALWEQVIFDYTNEQCHERFIAGSCARGALAFAASKYKTLLEVAPGEELATRMRERIMAMASHRFDVVNRLEASSRTGFPIPSFNTLLLLVGSFAFFAGILAPGSGNLGGVGISMFALAIGIRYFVKKPTSIV
jgi:hypothetical protein